MALHSQSSGGYNGSGSGGDGGLTVGDYTNGMPNIRLSQIPAAIMRQIPWMFPAITIMIAASWWFTKDIKREYKADGRILVQLGSEYVYDPEVGGNRNGGMSTTPDQIVQTEVGIIKTSAIIDQVINEMISSPSVGGVGGERFAPKLYEKWVKAPPSEKSNQWNNIIKAVDKAYVVMPKPKSSIVDLMYKHEDGEVAVKALDAFMNAYLNFRNNLFVSEASGLLSEQRAATEAQLNSVEKKIQRILNKNSISDFDSERTGVQKRSEILRTALNTLHGQMAAVEAALATSENQLRVTSRTIDLYVDDRAPQRLAQAELEKRQLLAKYLPTSNKVRAKELEIIEIRNQIRANGGKPAGGRRVGPNPIFQDLMKQRNTYQAQADSYREQEITIQVQLSAAAGKVKQMRVLGPTYKNLLREKATLEERLSGLNAKEQIALVNRQQQDLKSENIKIITRPSIPRKGRNMKKILFALSSLASIFTIAMLALLRVFLDPKLYSPDGTAYRGSAPELAPVYDDGYGYQPVPEAVPSPELYPQQEPNYAPAAHQYSETMPLNSADQVQEYQPYQPQPYEPAGYASPAYEQTIPDYEGQMYADGSPAEISNPYLQGGELAPSSANPTQQYAGPDGSIPVLGSGNQNPYIG